MKRLLLAAFCLSGSLFAETESSRPNFIFFISDDISQEDHGCYGHPVIKTPEIDRLATTGMRFDRAYLTISSCSPTRCSIITGRYPHNTGAPELHSKLPDDQTRFPELLREAGYYTALSGKNHMFGRQDRAFDKITGGGEPGGSSDWVQIVRDRPKDQPFFFWFAAYDAHRGWKVSDHAPEYDRSEVVVPPYNFDGPETRKDLALYYHEVSRFDHFVGRVRAELERQGILDNTFLVVASDNGRPFPRAKSRLYDSGIKTPWVVHYPKIIKEGAVTQSFVSVIDLSATCLELAGVGIPESIQGQSFLPILEDPQATVREVVFAEQNWHVYRNQSRLVRWDDFAYIRNYFPKQMNLCSESDTTYPAGKELWQAHAEGRTNDNHWQTFSNPYPEEELYDLRKDPEQLTNIAGEASSAEALQQARKLLAEWTEETGDTLPENPTPSRHGPPRIVDGKVLGWEKGPGGNPHAEFPGAARKATTINHPGPLRP
ncbi:sulfatase [Haloferula sp. A504]|uniref:sulfatase n=1 Tax=Haloferula sp. A504 TaxID=3373601 RepID=UPI0031C080B7|nr:sulfatase [Verrucomicrobiaceae bacterium E54]